jgi:hypothetical protein
VVTLVYRTDRDPRVRRIAPREERGDLLTFEVPGEPAPTVIYYYFEREWTAAAGIPDHRTTPEGGAATPFVYFVSHDHLGDLDRHQDFLDVFDLVRLVRHAAWNEAANDPALDVDSDGDADEQDLELATLRLLGDGASRESALASHPLEVSAARATLHFRDGSTFAVPRDYSGRITDLMVQGRLAGSLVSARRTRAAASGAAGKGVSCSPVWRHQVNEVFYRKEPHQMRRYLALAFDNIARDPWAFAVAAVYRAGRLFVVRGTDDRNTTQQFEGSRMVYFAGTAASIVYLLLFFAGVAVAWRARSRALILLLPIVYVPLTICMVLTNMRYTLTVQPLMFVFVAAALAAAMSTRAPHARSRPVQ